MRAGLLALGALTLLGCVSGGTGGGDRTVPVYRTPVEVPCEYEVMDTVRGQGSVAFGVGGGEGSRTVGERVLGRVGARVGADAVVTIPSERIPVRVAVPRGEVVRVPMSFEGEAIRYLDPACGSTPAPKAPLVLGETSAPGQCETWSPLGFSEELSLDEVEAAQSLTGALVPEGAELLPIQADQILPGNPDEVRELLRRAYPPLLRDAGITGTVRVLLLVAESGKVQLAHLSESSGHRALDDSALSVARQAEFLPVFSGRTPICHWVSAPFSFSGR